MNRIKEKIVSLLLFQYACNFFMNVYHFIRKRSRIFLKYYKRYGSYEQEQEPQLRHFLEVASRVPYYKQIIEQNKIDVNAKDIYTELQKMPLLNRETIISNKQIIINKEFKGKTTTKGSSGTTATALVFPCDAERSTKLETILWRNRKALGIRMQQWCFRFGGEVVVPINKKTGSYYKIEPTLERVSFSAFHLTKDTIKEYYDAMCNMRLTWIHGHAHNIVLLATLIIENGLDKIQFIKHITTGADSLFPWQRSIIQEAFPNAMIRQIYGLTEGVASMCEDISGELKINNDYAYVEFIPLNDNDPSLCQIVGTGFSNEAFPMIRYVTGDLATVHKDEDGVLHVVQIDGRTVDSIKLPDGRRISSTSMTNFEYTQEVKEVQFYQEDLYNIYVRIVKRPGYNEEEEKKVIASVRHRLPEEVNIFIEYVDKIERTKNGKIRYIISDIK